MRMLAPALILFMHSTSIPVMAQESRPQEGTKGAEVSASQPMKYAIGVSVFVDGKLMPLTTVRSKVSTGFFGAMKMGVTGVGSQRLQIPGKTSDTQLGTAAPEVFVNLPGKSITNLKMFRAEVKGKNREIEKMKLNAWTVSGTPQADERSVVLEEIGPGIYKISFPEKLEPGEYILLDQSAIAFREVWDFTITVPTS